MKDEATERFCLLLKLEDIKIPWLEEKTGIDKKRWSNIKYRGNPIRTIETQALSKVWPEYAYWLTTGEELPEAGQISPLSKLAQSSYKTAPKVG